MTVDHLHDALSELDDDLIAETDALRNQPPKRSPIIIFAFLAATAACVCAMTGLTIYHGLTVPTPVTEQLSSAADSNTLPSYGSHDEATDVTVPVTQATSDRGASVPTLPDKGDNDTSPTDAYGAVVLIGRHHDGGFDATVLYSDHTGLSAQQTVFVKHADDTTPLLVGSPVLVQFSSITEDDIPVIEATALVQDPPLTGSDSSYQYGSSDLDG